MSRCYSNLGRLTVVLEMLGKSIPRNRNCSLKVSFEDKIVKFMLKVFTAVAIFCAFRVLKWYPVLIIYLFLR